MFTKLCYGDRERWLSVNSFRRTLTLTMNRYSIKIWTFFDPSLNGALGHSLTTPFFRIVDTFIFWNFLLQYLRQWPDNFLGARGQSYDWQLAGQHLLIQTTLAARQTVSTLIFYVAWSNASSICVPLLYDDKTCREYERHCPNQFPLDFYDMNWIMWFRGHKND